MEYCAGGDLNERMKAQQERGTFEKDQVSVLCTLKVHTVGGYSQNVDPFILNLAFKTTARIY